MVKDVDSHAWFLRAGLRAVGWLSMFYITWSSVQRAPGLSVCPGATSRVSHWVWGSVSTMGQSMGMGLWSWSTPVFLCRAIPAMAPGAQPLWFAIILQVREQLPVGRG